VLLNAVGMRLSGDRPVCIAISQREVGLMANLSHYPTGRILRAFADRGLIATRYGWLSVEQPAILRDIAEGGEPL
jgi:hypothetical protein